MTDVTASEGEAAQAVVYLGNRQAIQLVDDPEAWAEESPSKRRVPIPGAPRKNCTTVVLAPGISLVDAINDIAGPRGLWRSHSDAEKPAWVASTWPQLAAALGSQWGIEVREPDPNHVPSGDGDAAPEPAPEG